MTSAVRFILMDIEGTTTDIAFVHRILFPYSEERLVAFIQTNANNADVQVALADVKKTVMDEEGFQINDEQVMQTLLRWIAEDRKQTGLKMLQGMIWRQGFEQGDYKGHVYPDVPPALKRWKQEGIGLGIYSSGSVQAQKLLFGYSVAGDLTPYFSHYFDTAVGGKKESDSYRKISQALGLPSGSILFLSDVEAELDAARNAGFQTVQLLRPGTEKSGRHACAENFADVNLCASV
jgi:enolase-phosphatase E1